jgi:hypothetical protein
MKAAPKFEATMAEKSNDELMAMLVHADDWVPEALDAARTELHKRKVDTSNVVVEHRPEARTITTSDAIGFLVGGISAAGVTVLCFRAVFPLPTESKPGVHVLETLVILACVAFLAGGFIGRAAYNALHWPEMLRPILGSFAAIGILWWLLPVREVAPLIGGMATCAATMLLLRRCCPP